MANAFSDYLEDNKSLTSKARIFIISNVGKKRKMDNAGYSRTSLLRFFELLMFFFSQSISDVYLSKSQQEMGEKSNVPTQQRKYKPRETSSKPPDEKQQKKKSSICLCKLTQENRIAFTTHRQQSRTSRKVHQISLRRHPTLHLKRLGTAG